MSATFSEALENHLVSLRSRRAACFDRILEHQAELGKIDAEIGAYENAKRLYDEIPTHEPPAAAKRVSVMKPVLDALRDKGAMTEDKMCAVLPGLGRASIHEFLVRGLRKGIVAHGARPDLFDLPRATRQAAE